jgi:hypothetical protein
MNGGRLIIEGLTKKGQTGYNLIANWYKWRLNKMSGNPEAIVQILPLYCRSKCGRR